MEVPLIYPRFPFSVLFSSRLAFKLLTLSNCLRRLQICKSESQRTDQNLPPCSLIPDSEPDLFSQTPSAFPFSLYRMRPTPITRLVFVQH